MTTERKKDKPGFLIARFNIDGYLHLNTEYNKKMACSVESDKFAHIIPGNDGRAF
jgi:hypothetical protein